MKPNTKELKIIILNTLILLVVVGGAYYYFMNNPLEKKSHLKYHFSDSESSYYAPDSIVGHIHQADVDRKFEWKEHPKGKIRQKTNNLGFREDTNTKEKKGFNTYRVIVTGDSHTDGVIYNNESFPNILENMYNKESSTKNYDFINTGAGYYGPQNYLGILKRYANLNPDAFIVTFYMGNDFLDAIRIEAENGWLEVPERNDSYYADLWELDEKHPGFTGQLMNQIKFFKTFPEFKSKAVSVSFDNLTQIKKICDKKNIDFQVVFLPTKADVEPQTDMDRLIEVKKILHFSDQDLLTNQLLTKKLIQLLKKENIVCYNLFDVWKGENMEEELYWKRDYHINHIGHKKIADFLKKKIIF